MITQLFLIAIVVPIPKLRSAEVLTKQEKAIGAPPRRAVRQNAGTVPVDWHGRSVGLGSLGTGNPELLHAKLERGTLDTQPCSRSIGAGEDPIGLLQNRQDMPSLDFLKRRETIRMGRLRPAHFQIGRAEP